MRPQRQFVQTPDKPSRRQRHWYRLKLRKLYRGLTGRITRDYTLTSDALGHTVLIFLRALHISIEIADRIAPWADMREIDQAASRIELTSYNVGYVIGRGIGLTFEDRERFKAWAFYPDISPEEFEERNAVERNTSATRKSAITAPNGQRRSRPRLVIHERRSC